MSVTRPPRWLGDKESAANAGATGDTGSIPGTGKSLGGGIDNPLQCAGQSIPGAEEPTRLQSTGVVKSWT